MNIQPAPLTNVDYTVTINGAENPFVIVESLSGVLRRPGIQPTALELRFRYPADRDPSGYAVHDGDVVKLYANYNGVNRIIWQGVIDDPENTEQSTSNGWSESVTKTAYDFRSVLAKVPFVTARQYKHTWRCYGADGVGANGAITYSEAQPADLTDNDRSRGHDIRFNAKLQFDEVVPDGAGNYATINDTDEDGAGRWYYINRTAAEIAEYIIANAADEITRALPSGVAIRFDESYKNIGKTDGVDTIPDEFPVTPGASVLQALQTLLDKTENWAMDINPSWYGDKDGEYGEWEEPTIVFYRLDDQTHTFDAWRAGHSDLPEAHPYNVNDMQLTIRTKPVANRVIGILTASGAVESDALWQSANQNRSSQPSLSVKDDGCVITTVKPSDDTITWHRVGRLMGGYVKVCEWDLKFVVKQTATGTANPKLDEYIAAGYEQSSYTATVNGIQYAIFAKPTTRVVSLSLGPLQTSVDGKQYSHSATIDVKRYRAFTISHGGPGARTLYCKNYIGTPYFIFARHTRTHRTDGYERPDDPPGTVTPFGLIPDVQQYKVDTLYGSGSGAVPVFGDLDPSKLENYCTQSEIDKQFDAAHPWRTGNGTPGSGRVITDMDFIARTVSDVRLNADGTLHTESQLRWNVARDNLERIVRSRFAQVAYAVTEGNIVILHERQLLRAHIDFQGDGIVTPLQFRVNVNTGSPEGTHYEQWQGMNARIISIDATVRQKLKLTLNDSPVLPGFTSRRRRGSKGGRVY